MNAFTKHELENIYRRRANRYDMTANLYYAVGFREHAYRRKAIAALELQRGDTVVEVSCGTGLNFAMLREVVGDDGHIIGVDMTDAMLAQARERVVKNGWTNIELVLNDAAAYEYPAGVTGIISTFAITLIPEYDDIIRRGAAALGPSGRWVVLDFKLPDGPLSLLAPLAAYITRPFGVTLDLAERHPWESIARHMKEHSVKSLYGGFAYVAAGWNGSTSASS